MNNDQLRAMYNSYGTLNRPQSYGDDLYNDRENMMPSAGQELTQTGTDEAGNPVMTPVEAPEAPRQEQAPLNNLIDFARSRIEQSQDNGIDITAGAGVLAPVVEGMRDLWNATPEERAQMLNVPQRMENAVRGVIHSMSNATELEHTQLYENYFYNPQRKNDEINRIAKLLQIDGNAFANNRELYQKAALAADRVERMGKFKKYQDAQGNIDMAKIYADIPGLADIQKQQGTAAAALALGNIDGVRSINDVYNNAFTRFVGSVYAGARRGWISDRRSSIWNDARKENRLPNAEEQKELDAYDAELRELPKYNYNTVGNVAGAMVGGAFENMAMIVKSQGAGALAGLAAGRVGGARAASIARNAASTYVMAQMIAGNQYEELVNRTDANGRPVYTPEQASWLALAQGAGEAVLEQYSLNQMGKAIFGRSAAPALRDIIKNSPTLEAAKAGVREYASTKIWEATKAGLISLGAEAAEEFNQAASDMLMENVAQVMINGQDAELSSIDDILTNSTGQMLEALPAIGGFGLIGFGANPVANTRAVLGFRSHVRDVVNNKILIGRMANAHYSEVLNGVWDNKKNIKELQDKAPEVAQTILDAQNKIAGIESGFVDVRALRQQEGGEALVQDIAERNNISADELAACLDGSGMLQVKTSTLMQMDLQDAERKAIMDNVTTSLDAFTEAQTKEAVKLAQDQMKSLQNFNDKTYKAAVDNIIAARFPDAEQAKLAREIIETNYDNPQEEFKRRLDAVNAEINEEIEPVLRELRSGMKQGTTLVRDAEGNATGARISNNDAWYSNYFADYGRAPSNRDLESLAIDIASGRQNPRYGLADYQNNTDETRAYFETVADKLDNLVEQRDALEAIQDRMRDLNPGEMVATASLSKEGLKVYDAMRRMMGESENKDVRKAGAFNALFLARYADNMAKAISKARNIPYTAEDFVRDRFRINVNAQYDEEQMAAQMFQESVADQLESEAEDALTELLFSGTPLQQTENLQKAVGKLDRVELNAVTFKDPESQKYMKQQIVKRSNLKKKDAEKLAEDFLKKVGDIVDIVETFYEKYPDFEAWQNRQITNVEGKMTLEQLQKDDVIRIPVKKGKKTVWVPLISAFRKNGEYPINIDLGTLCMKREAADFLNQILIKKGYAQKLGPTQLEALKTLLKQHGFLTACDVCFVETKRARMLADANKTAYDWLSTLKAAGLDDGHVLGEDRTLTDKQKEALEKMTSTKEIIVDDVPIKEFQLYFKEHMPEGRRRTKKDGDSGADLDTGTTPDKMMKIAKLFKQDPTLAGELSPETLLTTKAVDNLFNRYGGHTDIRTTISGMYGSATAKPLNGFVVYDPLSWLKSMNEGRLNKKSKQANNLEWLYDIGGGRAQSFTDFNPILFVDYVQMIADYEARDMPMHVYTKVPSFVKLFGRTGIMINMSFVPKIEKGVDADHLGLKWNEQTKEWEYAWHEDSFPIEEAYQLRERKDFGGRVGTIAVGVSKAQIEKMMTDPRIDMIIPYHKSGMAHSVQVKTGLVNATDYTDYQNTKIPDWHTVAMKYSKMVDPHFEEKMKGDTKSVSKYLKAQKKIIRDKYLNYSRILIEKGDPELAAQTYLDRCRELGCTPVFEMFAYKDGNKEAGVVNPGYYKMLEDFRGYDNDRKYVPQGPVKLELTDDWQEVLDEALGVREAQRKQIANMENNKELLDKAEKILAYQRIDGEIRETMVKRLKGALGDENVQSLRKDEFHDKLESIYKEEGASEEEARGKLEKFRSGDGIVYGFAKDGAIYLNEDYFNANTPAHEFTHVWAKVAQAKNPKLWMKGVGLLEKTQEWQNVLNDELYGFGDRQTEIDVMSNSKEAKVLQAQLNNEIASEVLSRVVGEQNEAYIEEMLRPGNKLYKGDGLIAEIKRWVADVFKEIRSLFDPIDGKPLTYDEFINMPLRALWDENGQKEFRKTVAETIQQMQKNKVQADAIEMQAAYHGTPNRFERFDTGHIGEGEGAQVHGWGLYFAKDRGVAENYRNRLTDNDYKVAFTGKALKSKQQLIDAAITEIRWGLNEGLSVEESIQKRIEYYRDQLKFFEEHPKQATKSKIKKAEDKIKFFSENKNNFKAEAQGQVFKADIPENDALLDEQKAFKDQDKNVQNKVVDAINNLSESQKDAFVRKVLKNELDAQNEAVETALAELTGVDRVVQNLKRLPMWKLVPTQARIGIRENLKEGGFTDEQIDQFIKNPKLIDSEIEKYTRENDREGRLNRYNAEVAADKNAKDNLVAGAKENIANLLKDVNGREIYNLLSDVLGGNKEASLKLNDNGIKGITYIGEIDGRSYVVFDDNAIKVLEKYYQQGNTAKGAISLTEQGQKIISLFETADQSTFVHEMAHMFLMDLQEIAGIDQNSQQAKDLDTIMKWAEYKPGQADEYKGTASAAEFRKREEAIKEAEAKGDEAEARRLKDVWAQERFARAFEEYLKSGEAPAAGLKRAFRQFKKWLVQIYNDVLGAGVRATPEVEAIMARMVASEDEIEAMAAANNIARLQKVDPDILSEDAQSLRDRWQEEAKERAKEKMLRELMKQYEQQNLKDLDKRLEDVRTSAREELQEMPCFVCEQLLADGTDMASALEICGYGSEQEYRDALQEAGGGMEQALDKMVAQARENMLKEMPSKDALYTMAEEALLSGDYNTRLATLEAEMLKAREASYRNAPARLRRALTEVDEAIKNFETQEVRKAVQKLKYAERWGAKELNTIQELEKHLADLDKADAKKEERQKVKEQFEAKYKELKQRTVQNEQWLRDVRDATDGKIKAMRIMARAQMANQQLSAATNPRHWHRQALSEGKKAWQEISRAQRKGEEVNARQAVRAKETQAYFDAMTAEAIKNRQKVDRMLNNARGIKARAKRMADPKFKADANLRYFHNHLLYVYGLRNSDAIAPVQEKAFTDVLAELRASHQFEEEVPAWLIAAAEATTQEKNYQQLTLGEFEELDKLTRVLYTLAKNQNQLLTLDVDMDTVVADCGTDWMNHVDYEVGNQRINDVKGAIGDYMNGLLKPEVLLSIMGGKDGGFIKYIYRVLFKAAEAEEIAREKEAAAQKALYNHYYTQQELRAMVNDPVMVDGPDGTKVKLQIGDDTDITKENLICMALNWGNEANRARLVVGLFDCENDAELAQKQAELMDVLAHTLTEKDWQFVQAMWDHINTFANPVSEVLEKSVGVPLDRVKADAFTVDLPDGQQLNMAGGYYPIVKDSGKSSRQSEFDQLEEAKAVGGVSVFGTGMSATKARTDNLFLNQGPLKLTLDVAHKHIQAQIHLIHAKMAVRDAYKVLNNKAIKDMIRRTCGEGTVKTMNEWVLNCWAPPVRPHSWYESMAASLRSKTVGAIMGYRVSTALLNLANVVYMAQEIGTKNALAAMADFYRHPMENRQAILDVSVFMRNRATNMDRDLGAQEEQFLKRHNMVGNAIDKATGGKSEEMRYLMDKYANWLIEQTDMLVSMPLYQWQYKETYSAEIAKGVPEEEARETANFEATRRVTKVFGSSRALDSSSVQRSKNEIVKLITPFFTFANTMMNAVWSHYYEGKYTADKKTFSRRYAAFARAILFNFVLGALVETMLRQAPDILAGSGGDDDDDKFMKDVGKNVIANAVAGFPGVNEFINTTYELFTEKKNYGSGRGVGVLSGSVERAQKVIQDMAKITQGSDKIDAIDFFRDVARAANVKTGMSDTITDAVFNTVRFAADGYSLDNMDDLREYIAKTLFDRKLKKK